MSTRRSRMAFIASFVGRAVVTGLALYGAKKLYEDYWQTKPPEDRKRKRVPTETESSDNDDASESVSSAKMKVNFEEALRQYYESKVCRDLLSYNHQLSILSQVLETVESLLCQQCPKLSLKKPEIKSYTALGSVGVGHCYDVYLPFHLDTNMWTCIPGSETVLPDAEGFYLIKRINREFFKPGTEPLDQFVVGQYLSSGKLHSYLHEQCLLMNTEREMRYRLTALVSQEIEFEIETLTDRFTFTLKILIELNHLSVLSTNMEENFWMKCNYRERDACLNELDDSTLRSLQCLLHCAKLDPILNSLPEFVFVNALLYILNELSNDVDVFESTLRFIAVSLHRCAMPNYFNPRHNILRFVKGRDCEKMAAYLDELDTGDLFISLLKNH